MPITDESNPYATSQPIGNLDPASVPALEPPQTVRFVPSTEGVIAYALYRTTHNPTELLMRRKARRYLIATALLWIGYAGFIGVFTPWEFDNASTIMLLLILASFGIRRLRYALVMNNPRQLAKTLQQTIDLAGEEDSPAIELTIAEAGIVAINEVESIRCAWQRLKGVVIDSHYVHLMRSQLSAYSIPRSAFPNEHTYLGFANLALQLWQQHKGRTE